MQTGHFRFNNLSNSMNKLLGGVSQFLIGNHLFFAKYIFTEFAVYGSLRNERVGLSMLSEGRVRVWVT